MYMRAVSWSSMGFLSCLGQFTEKEVRDACADYVHNGSERKDTTLAQYFLSVHQSGQLQSIMQNHPISAHRSNPLTHLTNAFGKVKCSTTAVSIYNDETCYEFHMFLIALLFAYTKSLMALKKAKHDRSLGYNFFMLSILLWKVTTSGLLAIHLNVLDRVPDEGHTLAMPNDIWKSEYAKYFSEGVEGRDDGGKPVGQDEGQKQDSNGKQDDLDELRNIEAKEVLETLQQFRATRKSHKPVPMAKVFGKWMSLLTIHYHSLDRLSSFYESCQLV